MNIQKIIENKDFSNIYIIGENFRTLASKGKELLTIVQDARNDDVHHFVNHMGYGGSVTAKNLLSINDPGLYIHLCTNVSDGFKPWNEEGVVSHSSCKKVSGNFEIYLFFRGIKFFLTRLNIRVVKNDKKTPLSKLNHKEKEAYKLILDLYY